MSRRLGGHVSITLEDIAKISSDPPKIAQTILEQHQKSILGTHS